MSRPTVIVKIDVEALPQQLRAIALRNADSDAPFLEYAADLIEYQHRELQRIADAAQVAAGTKRVARTRAGA